MEILRPKLAEAGGKSYGKVVMVLEGAGFKVANLGTEVTAEQFVEAVREHKPDIIGMSALLTTVHMPDTMVIEALKEADLQDVVKVMVGGAPVTQEYAQKIEADAYALDAASVDEAAKRLVGSRSEEFHEEAKMNSRERVLATLQHREPDRVPFDLGGAPNAGIHINPYRNLLCHWREDKKIRIEDIIFQKALVDEDVLQRLKVDFRGLDFSVFASAKWMHELKEEGKYTVFTDDWGIEWVKPKIRGLYYDMRQHPLSGRITVAEVDALNAPKLPSRDEIDVFIRKAKLYRERELVVVLAGPDGGILEHAYAIRGHKDFMIDMVSRPNLAKRLLDKILTYKLQYWELILQEMSNLVDVVAEGDDMATQERPMISPKLYRGMLKPLHRELFRCIRKNAKGSLSIHFHSCGAIKELIPDLIEIGVDALNPVQVSAAGMDTKQLKKEFGQDLTFWGGGIDTQHVLPYGTPEEVRDEVKRRIEDLAPGGGFVFAAVHNIQADVPPENIMAMWEALQEYGKYA